EINFTFWGFLMIRFTKMQGIGNDYIYINGIEYSISDPAELSRKISDRHFGVGSDGLILILPSDTADFRMRMFNADGSESEMCGNGIRCFSKYVYDRGMVSSTKITVETGGGIKTVEILAEKGKAVGAVVDMGIPELERARIPMKGSAGKVIDEELVMKDGTVLRATAVSMGNPHAVIFVEDAASFPVEIYGPEIENSPLFPARTNAEFVTVKSRTEVIQRTWERGSGETLACGTGASAVCAAGFLTGRTEREILSHLTGGILRLRWDEKTDHMFMSGPAVEVFEGSWPS
ncbi:MAG: diaminopimelate epimerase, partial [Spirochaetota bacterium]